MGYNPWSDRDYRDREKLRKFSGKSAFAYTDEEMRRVNRSEWKCNQKLDPKGINRESRDSATHPESLAIAVIFDHTGSMGQIPRILQKRLPKLMGLLMENGIDHPQVLFGAVGDATSDKAPLQIGQFESGIEMDDDLGRLLLEGNGGPYGRESYELAIYFAARHTDIDCWEKRKKKGYLFLIGDEHPYDVKDGEVRGLIGDKLSQNIPIEKIIAEAQEKYHVFFIIPTGASGGKNPSVYRKWVTLLGQEYTIELNNPEIISETISLKVSEIEKTTKSKTKKSEKESNTAAGEKKKKPGRIF